MITRGKQKVFLIIWQLLSSYSTCFLDSINIAWCIQVMIAPNESKNMVFKNWIPQGFNTSILLGGHIAPISTIGAKEERKKTQKKAKKDMISEIVNKIIP